MPRTQFDMVATLVGADPRDALTRDLDQSNTAYTALKMPAPLYYQPMNKGHDDGRLVGRIDTFTIEAGRVRATGEMFDGEDDEARAPRVAEDAREAVHMGTEGMVAPSIDPTILAVAPGEDGRMALTHADISGVTLVGMPAFVGTSITFTRPEAALTPTPSEVEYMLAEPDVEGSLAGLVAAARDEGWAAMDIAPRDHAWDGDAAAQRLAALCGIDDEDADAEAWNCYRRGFLWQDTDADPRTRGAYKLGVVDVVDGAHTIIPRAVFAVASVLQGGRGGVDIPAAAQAEVRRIVDGLYKRIADAEDDDLTPPWAEGEAALDALVAAVVEPAPAAAFAKPDTTRYDPGFRIEGRRIAGHLAALDACHLNWPGQCVTPPPSPSGYALFTRYTIATDAGELPVGRVTTGLGRIGNGCTCCDPDILDDHACPNRMGLVAAMAHHDRMPALADVVIGEDDGVIWVAGLLRPNLSAEQQYVLSRRVWSGDWRPAGEADELIEVLALHHGKPGFAKRVKTTRTRSVLVAAAGPVETPAPQGEADLGGMVARAVRGYAALNDLTASLAVAEQAQARAHLAALERTA